MKLNDSFIVYLKALLYMCIAFFLLGLATQMFLVQMKVCRGAQDPCDEDNENTEHFNDK